jgi:hypothetical protein
MVIQILIQNLQVQPNVTYEIQYHISPNKICIFFPSKYLSKDWLHILFTHIQFCYVFY